MEKFFLSEEFFLDWLLEQILPNVFLCYNIIFPFFAIKLGRFMANAFLHMLRALKFISEKLENKENQSLVGLTPLNVVFLSVWKSKNFISKQR